MALCYIKTVSVTQYSLTQTAGGGELWDRSNLMTVLKSSSVFQTTNRTRKQMTQSQPFLHTRLTPCGGGAQLSTVIQMSLCNGERLSLGGEMNQKWIILLRFFLILKIQNTTGWRPCALIGPATAAIKQKFRIQTLQYLHQPTRGYRGPNIWCEGSFNQRNENLPHIKSIIADITQLWRLVHGFFSQVIFFF